MVRGNKYTLYLVVIVMIVLFFSVYELSPNKNRLDKIKDYIGQGVLLQEESRQDVRINHVDVTFIKDIFDNVHLLFLSEKSVMDYVVLPPDGPPELRMYWRANAYKQKQLFVGVAYDRAIDQISVHGLGENQLLAYEYEGKTYFLAASPFSDNPVQIKGYSKEGELIYSNV